MIIIVVGVLGIVPKGLKKKTEETENQRKNWDHKDHSIVKINKNTEKSPGD